MTGQSPPSAPTTAQDDRNALSRDLSEFLIQLSIALHRYAMYPQGHPSLAPTVEHLLKQLDDLLEGRSSLSLGVARSQLIIEGIATDPKNPVLKELAGRLHRHHLGAVMFTRGVAFDEVHDMLALVSVEADRTGEPVGLNPTYHIGAWPHLRLYPLTYERLQLVADENQAPPTGTEEPESRTARTRAAQLWIGLARAALASEQVSAEPGPPGTATADDDEELDPTAVAQAIDAHRRDAAYDQVVVGYMLQIADELKAGATPESGALKRRVSKLVSTLDSHTLSRLLEMGGDRGQQRRFLLSASEGMAVDAVLELVRAAARSQEQTVSHSMLRLLQKLAQHAEVGRGNRRMVAETSVREQVAELVRGWSLKDPNPEEYRRALEAMSRANPIFAVAPDQHYVPEPRRVIEMAFEIDVMGDAVTRAVERVLEDGQLKWLLEILRSAHAPTVSEAVWQIVATPDRLRLVLAGDPLDVFALDLLARRMRLDAAEPMLEVLVESDSSQTRRLLLDRLVAMGDAVGPLAAARLPDERWFVQRNMLGLLGELPNLPPDFKPGDYLAHPDGRVRREALRMLLRDPQARERAICVGLTDADERTVRLALTAASRDCPAAAVPLIVARATKGATTSQRVTAIRILQKLSHHSAIETLLQITQPRRTLFGLRPPPKSREYLAALRSLQGHGSDARARQVLAAAARSRDSDVAQAAVGGDPDEDPSGV